MELKSEILKSRHDISTKLSALEEENEQLKKINEELVKQNNRRGIIVEKGNPKDETPFYRFRTAHQELLQRNIELYGSMELQRLQSIPRNTRHTTCRQHCP